MWPFKKRDDRVSALESEIAALKAKEPRTPRASQPRITKRESERISSLEAQVNILGQTVTVLGRLVKPLAEKRREDLLTDVAKFQAMANDAETRSLAIHSASSEGERKPESDPGFRDGYGLLSDNPTSETVDEVERDDYS